MRPRKPRKAGLELAIQKAGSITAIAEHVGRHPVTVAEWDRVPVEHCRAIEKLTGIHRSVLRPDIYGDEPPKRGNESRAAA